MRRPLIGFVAALVSLSACDDDVGIVRVPSELKVEPAEVDFGDVGVGLRRRLDLVLSNPGEGPVKIRRASADSLGTEFELADVPESLPAGGEVLASLSFSPSSAGPREGKILFETDSAKQPVVEVVVRGRGVDPALTAQPPILDFGRVLVGRTSSKAVTLTNNADFRVEVKRTERLDTTSQEFAPSLDRQWLEPGASMEVVVSYSPQDVGADEGRIRVLDGSPRAESLEIRVRGEGVDSDIEIEPMDLAFSGLHVGQTQSKFFYIRNIGASAHSVTRLAFESTSSTVAGELALTSSAGFTFDLQPQERVGVQVRYVPVDANADSDRVVVESTGLRTAAFVTVHAESAPAPAPVIRVTPASLSYGQVEAGQTKPLNVKIENIGNAPLTLTSVRVVASSAPFDATGAPVDGTVFPPADSEEFPVTYAPTGAGNANAELVIQSNDPATPEVRVPLSGTGTLAPVPSIFVDPVPVVFGQVPRGVPAARTVLIRNDGSANLVINTVRLTNDEGGRFTLVSPPAAMTSLFPGQPTSFAVQYSDGGAVASYTGRLEIVSNDPAHGTVVVPLQASTAPPPPSETDIAINLTWTLPANQNLDIDLHLIRNGADFFTRPDDCCFCNSNPEWGGAGLTEDNPFLDRDDLVGPGPENINLSTAPSGSYDVVVHFFSDYGSGQSTTVTLDVKLRGMSVATITQGMDAPERWIAGTINWDAANRRGTWQRGILGPFPTIFAACR